MQRIMLMATFVVIFLSTFTAFMLLTNIFVSMACHGPLSFEADEGSGAMVPAPDVPALGGMLQVGGVVIEQREVRAFVTNTKPDAERVHLCTYDCGETWDCRMALQKLHRDERKVLWPNSGAQFRSEVPCSWKWVILREDDWERLPATCPDTYRWGERLLGLERLASGTGHRRCP